MAESDRSERSAEQANPSPPADPAIDLPAIERELVAMGMGPAVAIELLTHNRRNQVTEGIWRVRTAEGSAVLKVVCNTTGGDPHWQPSDDPRAWNYWEREALAYEHGLTQSFAGQGVRAPALHATFRRTPGQIAIWLEDVAATSGDAIDARTVAEFCGRLGAGQGAWLRDARNLPAFASRSFIGDYTATKTAGADLLDDDHAWNHPLIARCFPADLRPEMLRLRRDRAWFLAVLDALPRVLSHLDVWPNNLLFADDGSHVLVDWAFVGDGAIGEDIGNLVPDAVFDRFVPAADLPALQVVALDAYIGGLRSSGWNDDADLARLGMLASCIKYDWLTHHMLMLAGQPQIDYGGVDPVDADERYAERGAALLELTRWAQTVRELVSDRPELISVTPIDPSI